MSQDDDSLRAETVQAGCKDQGIGTDETGDERGAQLDDVAPDNGILAGANIGYRTDP